MTGPDSPEGYLVQPEQQNSSFAVPTLNHRSIVILCVVTLPTAEKLNR